MAHFALLDENSIVRQVIVVSNEDCGNLEFPESEPIGQAFIKNKLNLPGVWKQTSYNTRFGKYYNNDGILDPSKNGFRKNYASQGFKYDEELDAFITPKPIYFNSYILNIETGQWEPPIPYPAKKYIWNEDILNWVEVG